MTSPAEASEEQSLSRRTTAWPPARCDEYDYCHDRRGYHARQDDHRSWPNHADDEDDCSTLIAPRRNDGGRTDGTGHAKRPAPAPPHPQNRTDHPESPRSGPARDKPPAPPHPHPP